MERLVCVNELTTLLSCIMPAVDMSFMLLANEPFWLSLSWKRNIPCLCAFIVFSLPVNWVSPVMADVSLPSLLSSRR